MVRITTSIPEDIKMKLENIAEEEDRSISWVVRELLQEILEQKESA